MECETVRELLGNYIDEDLNDVLRRAVDKHMGTCKSCRSDLASLSKTVTAMKRSRMIEQPSPWFAERLLHRLAQESDTSLTRIDQPAKDLQLDLW
jgi:predicted anti-sigma-YlaC factor YlaD